MTEPAWKQEERKVGRALGGERTPLSGENSRHTSGDVIETPFYVDCKTTGEQNATGERYVTLEREWMGGIEAGLEEEGKRIGFLTVRFKHCSDRYAFLPWSVWEWLYRNVELGHGRGSIMSHSCGGTRTCRIYRAMLQSLTHIGHPAGQYKATYIWFNEAENPIVGVTWESLLWLLQEAGHDVEVADAS